MTEQKLPNEKMLINQLREILLREDRHELAELKNTLHNPVELDKVAAPVIEHRIERKVTYLKENFKKEFGSPVESIVQYEIENSKEELMNALYPVVGKLIKKAISHQFQILQESIEDRLKTVKRNLSPKYLWKQVQAKAFGISEGEELLSSLVKPTIEEIYLIQKGSGLLMGSYSRHASLDQEVIAGMLTAIKAFVEDAFQQDQQELELIEWQHYTILIQNYYTFYIALAVTGNVSPAYRRDINEQLFDFAELHLKDVQIKVIDSAGYLRWSEKIKKIINHD